MRSNQVLRHAHNMAGLSIIELLVAMGLSLLLLIGVLTLFTSSRSSYETNDRVARVQENGRYAMDVITRDVRATGYLGCSSKLPGEKKTTTTLNQPAGLAAVAAYTDFSVIGYDYTSTGLWTPVLDTVAAPSPADGSDVLLLRQPIRGQQPAELVGNMATASDDLQITPVASGSGPFNVNQIVMIADCANRSVFQITAYTPTTGVIKHEVAAAVPGSLGNATKNLGNAYLGNNDPNNKNPAQLVGFQTVIYYVRSGTNGNGLWRRIGAGTPEELVEGVDSMQLQFGVDTNGDEIVDNYVKPDAVTDPADIMAVSVALLMRSLDQYGSIAADTNTYNLLDTNFTAPGDRRLRQTFTTTATLRNFAQ